MKLLVAPDKFKGTLNAVGVADAIARGFLSAHPGLTVQKLPIADGGEGTTETLATVLGARTEQVHTVDALGRPCLAPIAIKGDLAIFEVAAAAGLWQIEPGKRDPWIASTRGVGLILCALPQLGVRRVIIGLGGSATNDAGLGMARAMDYRFLSSTGDEVDPIPRNFDQIASVTLPATPLPLQISVLCDVTNPLLGPNGASHVYGPQKGLKDPSRLDNSLSRITKILEGAFSRDDTEIPRSGAAGGLAYGLSTFGGGKLLEGFETISRLIGLEAAVNGADLIVTGEGKIDRQTLSGKGPAGIARLAKRLNKPIYAFCGAVEQGIDDGQLFDAIHPLVDGETSSKEALADTARLLENKARSVGATLKYV